MISEDLSVDKKFGFLVLSRWGSYHDMPCTLRARCYKCTYRFLSQEPTFMAGPLPCIIMFSRFSQEFSFKVLQIGETVLLLD